MMSDTLLCRLFTVILIGCVVLMLVEFHYYFHYNEMYKQHNCREDQEFVPNAEHFPRRRPPLKVTRIINFTREYSGPILYNMVPKCGSTTLRMLLKSLHFMNSFSIGSDMSFRAKSLDHEEQRLIALSLQKNNKKFLYYKHLLFIDFTRFGYDPPLYINLIRDPLELAISNFYYIREKDVHTSYLTARQQNTTFDECVLFGHAECINYNMLVPFFCGQDPECLIRDDNSLSRALHNIDRYFGPIGVIEEMRSFLSVLEYLYPQYFRSALRVYDVIENRITQTSSTKHKIPPQQRSRDIMRSILGYEYQLYHYIRQRFQNYKTLLEPFMEARDTGARDTGARDMEKSETKEFETDVRDTEARDTGPRDMEESDRGTRDTKESIIEARHIDTRDTETRHLKARDIEARDT